MSFAAAELFGNEVESKNGLINAADAFTNKKLVGVYFSAHWCPPCRRFTPQLAEFYSKIKDIDSDALEIIFCSCDRDEESFRDYYGSMPWLSMIFQSAECDTLQEKCNVDGIPCLAIFDGSPGELLDTEGVSTVMGCRGNSKKAMARWNVKIDFEFAEPTIPCTAASFGASLVTKSGESPTEEALSSKKLVGVYFSAHWCPPCRGFTPKLAEFYNQVKAHDADALEIVFSSCDRDEDSFKSYYSDMPWLATKFRCAEGEKLAENCNVSGIPHLVIINRETGVIVDENGRSTVSAASGDIQAALAKWKV